MGDKISNVGCIRALNARYTASVRKEIIKEINETLSRPITCISNPFLKTNLTKFAVN